MIKTLYYGDSFENGVSIIQRSRVSPIDRKLLIQTPVLAGGTVPQLNMLYYNNINRYGEVLSTMVAMFDIEEAQKSNYVLYDTTKFGMNSNLERTQSYVGVSNRWRNADLIEAGVQMLENKSKTATHPYEHYNVDTDLSHDPYKSSNFMFDGWYSLVSTTPPETPVVLEDGVLRTYDNTIEYMYDGVWYPLEDEVYTEAPIGNIIRKEDAVFVETPFLVAFDTVTLYDSLLTKELDGEWFTNITTIRYKYRSIQNAAEDKALDKAQILIRSMDLTLLATK